MSRCEIRTPEGRRPRRLPHGVKGNFAPRREKDPADAGILMRTPLASVSGAQQKGHGVKGNFAPRREKDPADAGIALRTFGAQLYALCKRTPFAGEA